MATSNSQIVLEKDGSFVKVQGVLDGPAAAQLVESMDGDTMFTLDFCGVSDVNFAALRAILNCRKAGLRFCIINAEDRVAEKFEDTGVSVFVNVCRKPKPLDMSQYSQFGQSFLSKAFNSSDGDSIIKVYGDRVPRWLVAQEKTIARSVMVFGINTPLVGTLYESGDNTALDFERIEGKRSFARVISEEPERLEEMALRFARMTKQLHTTQCDTTLFNDRSVFYRRAVTACTEISEQSRAKLLAFMDSVPAATTCLHGDLQPGNVITNGREDLWIDLADFGYGNPMYDMGMWGFQANYIPEKQCEDVFHFGKAQMKRFWDIFIAEYFDARTPEAKAEAEARIDKFTGLHMIYLGVTYGFEPYVLENIKRIFSI